MDRDESLVINAQERFEYFEKRANLKSQLKQANTDEERKSLQIKIEEITSQIKEL